MNDFHRIFPKEGFFHQPCKPMGRCHNAELSYLRKKRLFKFIVLPAPVKETGSGIGRFLRAMMTSCFPFVTMDEIKVGTVTGKGPAVMQSPYYRFIIR